MANIKISDLVNVYVDNDGLYDSLLKQGSPYEQLYSRNSSVYNRQLSPKTLEINLDTIYYDYTQIVQDIVYNLNLNSNSSKFSGPAMDAAYSVYYQVRDQNKSHDDHHTSIHGIAAALEKAVGYHFVMGMLMKYLRDEDLSNREWEAISNFLYNREKKPYQWDAEARAFRIKGK